MEITRFNRAKTSVKQFSAGDFVFLKCYERNETKLDRKFKEPFKITKLLDNNRYELQNINIIILITIIIIKYQWHT